MNPIPTHSKTAGHAGKYILTLCCPDRLGITAAVSGFLTGQDCNIIELSQFCDENTGKLFMRTVFTPGEKTPPPARMRDAYSDIGSRFSMDWNLYDASDRPKVLILVSKADHCLNDLLYRHRVGSIFMEVCAVVSNHPDLAPLAAYHAIAYHHLPVTDDTRDEQEARLLEIVAETGAELVILARYMRILSPNLCRQLVGRVINIHHSFLPSFRGARPYHQAYAHGVKVIGATAHYVTESLDEGPIIAQDTAHVTHAHTPEELVSVGSNLENLVLARAVRWHCEHRIFLNGKKTIVFQ